MGTSPIVLATLVALLVGGFATATAARHCDTDADTIRLPGGSRRTAAGGRPWECCDWVIRDPNFRPTRWQCNDVVAKCSAGCRDCEEMEGGVGYVCRDWVISLWQPPVCTPRPWDCCDNAVCNRRLIPDCRCADEVESCPSNCKKCEVVESSDPPLYRCLDSFHGYPGPKCTSPWISKESN